MDEDAMSPSASSSEKVPVRTEANVKALNEDIMDIFAEHAEANAWFRAWRGLHLNARLS
jgi:hypothetical protein